MLRGQLEQVAGQFNNAKSNVVDLTAALRDHKSAHAEAATGIKGVNEALEGVAAPIRGAAAGFKEMAEVAGVAFVVERVSEFAKEMAELGERTLNAAAALELSVPRYAQLASVLQLAGADAETARRALERLAVSIVEATRDPASKAAVAFRNVGVSEEEIEMVVDVLTRVRANLVSRPNEMSTPASAEASAPKVKIKVKADSLL